jgi:hypothetical protein
MLHRTDAWRQTVEMGQEDRSALPPICGRSPQRSVLVLRPAIFNRQVLPLDIVDFREALPKGIHAVGISFERSWRKESDHRHLRPLRARYEWPRSRPGYQ